jgi:hypothetical protein
MAHMTSNEAFDKLAKAVQALKEAKKRKADKPEIKKLEKAVNDARAVANLFK